MCTTGRKRGTLGTQERAQMRLASWRKAEPARILAVTAPFPSGDEGQIAGRVPRGSRQNAIA
eukprot:12758345-Alexandrium_andersonii.AAC.1